MYEVLLDKTVQFFYACGEDNEISDNFKYLGRVVCKDSVSSQEVLRRIGHGHQIFLLLLLLLSVPVQADEDSDLQVDGHPCLTLWL